MPIKWDLYKNALTVDGETRRDRAINETQRSIIKRSARSPAYKTVLIDGNKQQVVITATSELPTKKINALPNEHIYAGSIVLWNKRHWLITYVDCEDEVYQRGTMQECNIYLKWQDKDGNILGRYGYAEDITQYATGVVEGKIINSLELNYKIQLPLDKDTVLLRRDKRFLIDVFTSEPNAYILTNRNVISMNFNPEDINEEYEFDGRDKVLMLTVSQTQLSRKDNVELMIADYFEKEPEPITPVGECSILYKGKPEVKLGGNFKTFTAQFKDNEGNIVTNITPIWTITSSLEQYENKIISEKTSDGIKIKIPDEAGMLFSQIKIELADESNTYHSELFVKVVNLYG